jgi:hypothetical protein
MQTLEGVLIRLDQNDKILCENIQYMLSILPKKYRSESIENVVSWLNEYTSHKTALVKLSRIELTWKEATRETVLLNAINIVIGWLNANME